MKIFFSSRHNYLDEGNGASITTREQLLELVRRGHDVKTFCGAVFNGASIADEKGFFAELRARGLAFSTSTSVARQKRQMSTGAREELVAFKEARFNDSGIDSFVYLPLDEFGRDELGDAWTRATERVFLARLNAELREFRPDIFLTYGGHATVPGSARRAKSSGASAVFMLHNLGYTNREHFAEFDSVVVPSEYARRFYDLRHGLKTRVLTPLIDERKVKVTRRTSRFATFVNPSPEKGTRFFLGLALELRRRRPDIPLAIAESRGKVGDLLQIPESRGLTGLYRYAPTRFPSTFLSDARVLLAPSVCDESFGRVVAEAGLNGIPVLCSDRGALPEVAGDPRLVLPIPPRFTPSSLALPTSKEVEPWINAIEELWDHPEYAARVGRSLRSHVLRYSGALVSDETERLFEELAGWSET